MFFLTLKIDLSKLFQEYINILYTITYSPLDNYRIEIETRQLSEK